MGVRVAADSEATVIHLGLVLQKVVFFLESGEALGTGVLMIELVFQVDSQAIDIGEDGSGAQIALDVVAVGVFDMVLEAVEVVKDAAAKTADVLAMLGVWMLANMDLDGLCGGEAESADAAPGPSDKGVVGRFGVGQRCVHDDGDGDCRRGMVRAKGGVGGEEGARRERTERSPMRKQT
jgi:hypothetical protein